MQIVMIYLARIGVNMIPRRWHGDHRCRIYQVGQVNSLTQEQVVRHTAPYSCFSSRGEAGLPTSGCPPCASSSADKSRSWPATGDLHVNSRCA